MKKLMIAAAIVCAAVMVQAATVSWDSGSLKTVIDANGGWGTTTMRNNYTALSVALYTISATDYAALDGKSQEDIFKVYSTKTAAGTVTAEGNTKTSLSVTSSADVGVDQFAVLIYNYTDKSLGKDFYIASRATIAGTVIDNPGNTYNVANIASGATGGWQAAAVPEPTSGLLLILGVAGLALRRRRA